MTTGNTTVPTSERPPAPNGREYVRHVPALITVWAEEQKRRIGELLLLDGTGPWTLGRDDELDISSLAQQRPGAMVFTGRLAGVAVSRRQFAVEYGVTGIEIVNLGKAPLRVNGVKVDKGGRCALTDGDRIEVVGQYAFLFTTRPVKMRKLEALTGPLAPFGEPDAHGNVGESPDVWALRDQLAFAAKSNFHVLLHGESGTGKELAARAIHARSSRAKGPFIACNVTTLSPGLIDGLLWGNKVNYPQAGMAENKGLVGRAHGGTLFLDEIGHLPIELQAKLLRFMDENGEYQPLGDATRYADVRIIAATNRDVSELKHDLLKRLDLHVELPSLDTHPEDVPLLARHILLFAAIDNPELNIERFIRRDGQRPEVAIEPALMLALVQHTYDGNVRELRKVLLRAIATAAADATSLVWSDMLDPEGDVEVAEVYTGSEMTPQETKELIERFQWNVKRAAKFRKMSRSVLTRLIKRHGLVRPRGQ